MLDGLEKQLMDASVLCWPASVDSNGQPNVSPKEVFCLYPEQRLLIANIASPISVKNIKLQPQVCVSMVDVFCQKGVKLLGAATIYEPGDKGYQERSIALSELAGPEFKIVSVIEFRIEKSASIMAPSYRIFPERTETEQIARAMKSYGVQPR